MEVAPTPPKAMLNGKRLRKADPPALALELFFSTLNGMEGERKAKVAQTNHCGRSQDGDAHHMFHFLHTNISRFGVQLSDPSTRHLDCGVGSGFSDPSSRNLDRLRTGHVLSLQA